MFINDCVAWIIGHGSTPVEKGRPKEIRRKKKKNFWLNMIMTREHSVRTEQMSEDKYIEVEIDAQNSTMIGKNF